MIETLTKPGQLKEWLEDTAKEGQDTVALDVETTGLTRGDRIISCAITGPTENHIAFFGPQFLEELLSAPIGMRFVMHNASFDLKMLAWHGIRLHDKYEYTDTMILAHLLDENKDLGLGDLVLEHFNDNYKKEFWDKYKKAEDASEKELKEYNAKDVRYTFLLHRMLQLGLNKDRIPDSLTNHVHQLQRTLLETEIEGIKVDKDYLINKGTELKTRITQLLPEMRESVKDEIELIESEDWLKELDKRKTEAGKARVKKPEFTFDSAKQLMRLLYDKLQLPKQYNQKTKQPSVDYESLQTINDQHILIPKIQEYRELNKVYTAYIEGTLDRMYNETIYPNFNVTGTATGRISHSNPNLGQLPRSGGIRGIYIPRQGYAFLSADFSQLEVCLSAHFTRDANLLKIVNEGASQHDITAAALGIDRNTAKTLNFAMQYGCSHFKVAKILGVSIEEGKKAHEKYWETYAGQKAKMDECAAKVDSGISIESPFGRRRRFEKRERKSWDSAYRQAWNALVQGTGADCTSRAFYLTDAELKRRNVGRALFTVHDEIIIEAKKEYAAEAEKILLETMESVGQEIGLTVKLKAQGSGPCERWED